MGKPDAVHFNFAWQEVAMPLVDHHYIDRVLPARKPIDSAGQNHSLLDRARHLLPKEKLLIELAFKNQLSHRQIAQILQAPAGTISRRLQRICRKLRDPMILSLMDDACALSEEHRTLALEHFLHRRPVAELAKIHQLSDREISRMLDYVRGWFGRISHARHRSARS